MPGLGSIQGRLAHRGTIAGGSRSAAVRKVIDSLPLEGLRQPSRALRGRRRPGRDRPLRGRGAAGRARLRPGRRRRQGRLQEADDAPPRAARPGARRRARQARGAGRRAGAGRRGAGRQRGRQAGGDLARLGAARKPATTRQLAEGARHRHDPRRLSLRPLQERGPRRPTAAVARLADPAGDPRASPAAAEAARDLRRGAEPRPRPAEPALQRRHPVLPGRARARRSPPPTTRSASRCSAARRSRPRGWAAWSPSARAAPRSRS